MRSLLLLSVFASACATVPAGTVGVWTRWGAVNGTAEPGLYFYDPVGTDCWLMDARVQRVEIATSASSSDLQEVTTTVVLNYRIGVDHAVDIFEGIGTVERLQSAVIEPALQEAVKTATANYTASELISKRAEVKTAMETHLAGVLSASWVLVDELSITNFSFSESFQRAIEAKQVAEQAAQQAENDLVRIRTEAEQEVATAEGHARAQIAEAQAEAEAQRLLAQEITAETLQLRAIEKWNGVLPTTSTGGSELQFLLGH